MTEILKKYLNDSVNEEAELLKDSIIGGATLTEAEQVKITTLIATLARIADIDFEEIVDFYNKGEE